jgi:hypothetical protein
MGFIITENKLKELLEKAFTNGAFSYANWKGQSDTCWTNVNEDMKEEVYSIINDLINE